MKFACPKCEHACGLFSGACPSCGFYLTVRSVFTHYLGGLRAVAAFRCPKCQQPVPMPARVCGHCGAALTVGAAIDTTVAPSRRRWQQFLATATPATRRRIQRCYLLFSGALLWWLLVYVQEQSGGAWIQHAALSVVFLSVFALLALYLVPRQVFRAVFWGASRIMKLALVFNFLTSILVIQFAIGVWWGRAVALTILFGVIWLAGFVFHQYLLPMAAMTERVFLETDEREFDSSASQGRNVRLD